MKWKNNLLNWLKEQDQSRYEFIQNCDLSSYTTLGLKSCADLLKIKDEKFLIDLFLKFSGEKFIVIGKGANVVLPESSDKVFIKLYLKNNTNEFESMQKSYFLSVSTPLSSLVAHAVKFNLLEWDILAGIPGTLGGAIAMNAGIKKGAVSHLLEEIRIIRSNGSIDTLSVSEKDFIYRGNLILNPGDLVSYARLRTFGTAQYIQDEITDYLKKRRLTQPLSKKTCGSVFKNNSHYLAGQSIDLLGLKGLAYRDLSISLKHSNFIENKSQGNQSDFVRLTTYLNKELELTYGIKFELEARLL